MGADIASAFTIWRRVSVFGMLLEELREWNAVGHVEKAQPNAIVIALATELHREIERSRSRNSGLAEIGERNHSTGVLAWHALHGVAENLPIRFALKSAEFQKILSVHECGVAK
jgi:hypothetical protein